MTKTNLLSKPRGGIKSWLSLQIRRTFSSRLLRGTLDTAQVAGVTWPTTQLEKSRARGNISWCWFGFQVALPVANSWKNLSTISEMFSLWSSNAKSLQEVENMYSHIYTCNASAGSLKDSDIQSSPTSALNHFYAIVIRCLFHSHHPHYHKCSHLYSSGHVTIWTPHEQEPKTQ